MKREEMTTRTTRSNAVASVARRRGAAVALAATLAVAGTVAVAPAQPGGPANSAGINGAERPQSRSDTQLHVQRYQVHFSPFNIIDVPPRAEHPGDYKAGDYVVFSDRLLNRSGRRVGTQGGSGLLTKVTSTKIQVHYTLAIHLPGGQLAADGLSTNAATKRLALVGGTGRYLGAIGHLELTEAGDGTGSLTISWRRG